LRTWRKASRLTAELVAQRAGISRDTLRAIEDGSGSVKLENVFAVLEALGLDSMVTKAVDPAEDDRGRALLQRGLPERVRS
jgi:transcriptional regulator with XRE-family HTH domain